MVDDSQIVTHSDPAWRDRTNFIVRLDLAQHGLPGRWEQCWTHTGDQHSYEMCCIPFFAYGISLGDVLHIDADTGAHSVVRKSGHRTIRIAFLNNEAAHGHHDRIHDALVSSGVLVEFRGQHYASIDIANEAQLAAVLAALTPLLDARDLLWEWADPVLTEE